MLFRKADNCLSVWRWESLRLALSARLPSSLSNIFNSWEHPRVYCICCLAFSYIIWCFLEKQPSFLHQGGIQSLCSLARKKKDIYCWNNFSSLARWTTWSPLSAQCSWSRQVRRDEVIAKPELKGGWGLPFHCQDQAGFTFERSTESQQWNYQWGKALPEAINPPFTCTLWATAGPQYKAEGQSFQVDIWQGQVLDICSCWPFKRRPGEDEESRVM